MQNRSIVPCSETYQFVFRFFDSFHLAVTQSKYLKSTVTLLRSSGKRNAVNVSRRVSRDSPLASVYPQVHLHPQHQRFPLLILEIFAPAPSKFFQTHPDSEYMADSVGSQPRLPDSKSSGIYNSPESPTPTDVGVAGLGPRNLP
jgi:hypothetical protein